MSLLNSMLAGTLTWLFLSSSTAAQLIVDPDLDVAGKPVVDWLPDFFIWAASEPEETNVMYDETGQFQHLNQHGPVWFLPQDFLVARQEEPFYRELSFRVPSDKYILSPIYTASACDPDPSSDQIEFVKGGVPRWPIEFSFGGISVSDSKLKSEHRVDTEVVHIEIPAPNLFVEDPASDPASGYCAIGGYWVTVAPLSPGQHVIEKSEAGWSSPAPPFPNGELQKWTFNITSVLPGDLDADGDWTAADIDLLSSAIREAANDVYTDVNGDGSLDQADHTYWVDSLASILAGDADFNGTVEFADFLALSSSFGQAGGWSQGDFDGNREVNFTDFLTLSTNFGQTATGVAAVPEPSSSILLMLALGAIKRRRRST